MHCLRLLISVLALLLPDSTRAAGTDTTHAAGTDDLSAIALVSTGAYDPRSEQGRGLKEFFSGLGAAFTGPNTDLAKQVQQKLDNPALRSYFPDAAERARIAQTLGADVKRRYLSNGYTNESVDAALRYLTDRIVGTVVVRVLMKEGVKDVARAGAWADKIKAPFDRCVGLSRSYLEARKCGAPLESDLMKNVGLALAHELTRQEFGAGKSAAYLKCLRAAESGANDRVRPCAIENVRSSASEFGRKRVLEEAKKHLPAAGASGVVARVMPAFDQCLKAANERAGFRACGDKLLGAAGAAIAEQSIRLDERVKAAFPVAADLDRVAKDGRDTFLACVDENRRRNLRDSAGNVALDSCRALLTRKTATLVAEARVRAALKEQLGENGVVDEIVSTLVRGDFAACLGENAAQKDLDACTLKLEKNVAFQAAEKLIPARISLFLKAGGGATAYGLDDRGARDLAAGVLAAHKQCLKTRVRGVDPGAMDAAVNDCFKATIRDLALKLGRLELRKTAKANGVDVSTPAFEKIAQDFADNFGACLDRRKDASFPLAAYLAGLDSCQAELTRATTTRLARSELTSTIKELLGNAGAEVEGALLAELDACMKKAKTAPDTDACVAALRASGTVRLAKAGVHKRAAEELSLDSPPPSILALDKHLDACVAEKKKTSDDCAVAYVKEATAEIGHLKLDGTLRPMFGDEKMKRLAADLARLEGPFKACIEAVPPPLARAMLDAFEACGTQLTTDAMTFLLEHQVDDAPAAAPPKATPPSEAELTDMLARSILCLNGALEPGQEAALANLEPGSMEEKLLQLVGAYVSYDVKAAGGRVEEALASVAEELKAAGPVAARRKLVDQLTQRGMADQLLKALVKRDLESALSALPEGKKLAAPLAAKLTDKATLDAALGEEAMAKLRPLFEAGVLQPVLVDGRALDSAPVLRAFRAVRSQAVDALLTAPPSGFDEASRNAVKAALK